MSKITYKVAALTHVGKLRDHNEDNFILAPNLSTGDWYFDMQDAYSPASKGAVWVVADGMGGANAGEVASELAIQTVKQGFNSLIQSEDEFKDPQPFLRKLILEANENILSHAQEHPETEGMGTTLVIAWLLEHNLHVSWVGDSRAYLFRSQELSPISKDHSLVQEMVDAGKLTEDQAFYHPNNNIITQSLGGESEKLDPGYKMVELFKGDKILLCSDGLNGMLTDARIQEIIAEHGELDPVSNELLQAALEEGGHDNITLVYAEITEGKVLSKSPVPAAAAASDVESASESSSNKRGKKGFYVLMLLSFLLGAAVVYYAPVVWSSLQGSEGQKEKQEESQEEKQEESQEENQEKNQEKNREGDSKKKQDASDTPKKVTDESENEKNGPSSSLGNESGQNEKQDDNRNIDKGDRETPSTIKDPGRNQLNKVDKKESEKKKDEAKGDSSPAEPGDD